MTAVASSITPAVCVGGAVSALGIALGGPTFIDFTLNSCFSQICPLSAHYHVLPNSIFNLQLAM